MGSTKFNDHFGRRGQRRFPLLRQLYWVGVFFTISNVYAGSLDALSPLLRVTPRERVINECRQLISKKVRSDVNFLGSPSEAPSPADLMVYRDGVEKPIPDYFDFKIEYVLNGFVEGRRARCYVDHRKAQPVAKQVGFLRD